MSLLPLERMRVGPSVRGRNSSAPLRTLSSSNRRPSGAFGSHPPSNSRFLKPMPASFAKNGWVQIPFQTSLSTGNRHKRHVLRLRLDCLGCSILRGQSSPPSLLLGDNWNVIPFVPTPSLLFIVVLVVTPGSGFQGVGIVEIASIAALGATIGKLASYALGYGARRAIGKPERFDSLRKYLGGSTFLVGVVLAASPLVDTAYIPLGMIRYSLPKTLLSLYTGKFIWILTVLYVARQSSQLIPQTFGGDLYTTVLSIALLIPIAYFLIIVDWENRLLGRKNTLRNRIIARIRNYFSKEQSGTSAPAVNN